MTSYYSSVFLEQFSHLGLRQPHGFFLQAHINLGLSVFSLVYDYLVLVHFFTLFHGANIGNNSGNNGLIYFLIIFAYKLLRKYLIHSIWDIIPSNKRT